MTSSEEGCPRSPRKPPAAWVWKNHKKYLWLQDHSTRRDGRHLSPDAEEYETSFLFLFYGESSFFKLSIIFSLTPSREQTVLFVSDS